jgi:hypothetical protein
MNPSASLTASDIAFASHDDESASGGTLERLAGGGYAYLPSDDLVRVEARFLRRDGHQLHAEIDVQCEWAGVSRHGKSLSCADLNLSSQTARKTLAKHCSDRAKTKDEFDWLGIMDAACLEIIRAERRGAEVIVLDDAPHVQQRDHDVCGLLVPADAASILIAHGDSLKSMTTLFVLGTLAQRGHRVLYLDWEWSADRHRARKRRLFGDERLESLRYLRCNAPLVHEADRIRRYCDEHQISFIAVDSVGLACDGKLIDDDVAIRFHRALASLPPALCAAHVPKSAIGPDAKGDAIGPFGSVFFSNLCRASWLVKKQPGASDDVATVGLFPQKQNDGSRRPPVGLEFTFATNGRIDVRNVDLATVEGLAEKLPIASRIRTLLQSGPPRSYAEIAEELGEKPDSVIKAVRRNDVFVRVPSADGIHRIALVSSRRESA